MSADEIDNLLKSGAAKRLGIGSRRACYTLPGGRLCVKCYRSDAEIAEGKHPGRLPFKPIAPAVAQEISRFRFDKKRNTCCQEYAYWKELKERLAPDDMAFLPSVMETVLVPSRGWCVVEELISNADASPVRKFHEEWLLAGGEMRARLIESLDAFAELIERHAIRIYDPQNILVQKLADGSIRLRVTDFEPASRTLVPFDRLSSAIARMKIRRRMARYRRSFGIYKGSNMPSVAALQALPPVNVLCMKWGDYYTADYVNRLYAGVRRNLVRPFRFVCMTDDSTGFAPGIEAVPFPDDPKVPGKYVPREWPNIFAKLAVFKDGFAGLSGPTLFLDVDLIVTGPLDRFFAYKPGEFCIIHNWVERRKSLFRKTPDIGNSSCFRFEAGKSNGVWETFLREKDIPGQAARFQLGSQKFQTYAMMKTGKVNWWPSDWVCSFKRQLIPVFPLNKIFAPWRPPKSASIVAFHGQPDLPQALEGYYRKYDKPAKMHLTCKPTKWILEYWHE